ncbi:hypothetical protein GCM10025867_02160 [Frondihabitans sucicola]|uniref:Xylose isomerase-like TIM barrel domain-containing protein n=1 Tax=Frondihabitans sucicola TaxID=1268041 RepID=A0ABN6XWE2_9MICO|nr:TIM barrel protein [Frondihabitans sucicola]BDZ47975.1 hypothetical protein GCM10025867_02160 [Frondihabitans sucicola]
MNHLNTLRYACQTYSWQMSGDRYRGDIDHMTRVAKGAGFTGFEAETLMLGPSWTESGLHSSLDAAGLDLAAIVLVHSWRNDTETPAEKVEADQVIRAVAGYPDSKIVLVNTPGPDRDDLFRRQDTAVSCMAAIADRAADVGVTCTVHPNSPAGSVFRTADDYDRLGHLMSPTKLRFTPDIGHITVGGMDPSRILDTWWDLIDHIHIKDVAVDGSWAATGTGTVDIPGILNTLAERSFAGWVTFEDESPEAESDPDRAVEDAGAYLGTLTRQDFPADTHTRRTRR